MFGLSKSPHAQIPHDRPGRLRPVLCRFLRGRILVGRARFAPTAVFILTALEPIAPRRIQSWSCRSRWGAIPEHCQVHKCNSLPSGVPRADPIPDLINSNRIPDATRFRIETDVTEQFERARVRSRSWIENPVVISERMSSSHGS